MQLVREKKYDYLSFQDHKSLNSDVNRGRRLTGKAGWDKFTMSARPCPDKFVNGGCGVYNIETRL